MNRWTSSCGAAVVGFLVFDDTRVYTLFAFNAASSPFTRNPRVEVIRKGDHFQRWDAALRGRTLHSSPALP